MNNIEKRNFNMLLKNIKSKQLIKSILNDSELKKEAMSILNVTANVSSEINIGEIIKDKSYKKEIQDKMGQDIINSIENKHFETHEKTKQIATELDEKEKKLQEITNKLVEYNKKRGRLAAYIKEQEEQKEEYDLVIGDLDTVKDTLKENRKKKHEIQNEISAQEEFKERFIREVKNLKEEKNQLSFDISREAETIKLAQEQQKKSILESYEEQIKEKKERLNKKIEEITLEKKNLSNEVRELVFNKKNLLEELDKIREEKKELLNKEIKLEIKSKDLFQQEEKINRYIEKFLEREKEIEENAKKKFEKKIQGFEEDIEYFKEENIDLSRNIRRLEKLTNNSLEIGELGEEISALKRNNEKLENKILGKNDDRVEKIKLLEHEIESLEGINNTLRSEKSKLHEEKMELLTYKDNIEIAERALDELDRSKESLIKVIEKREIEISELKSKTMSVEAKKQAIEQTYFNIEKIDDYIEEKKWLERMSVSFEKAGFIFSTRLLYAFHTALKISDWSSLSILAGVSGTGKSELPRLYSECGGINFLPLAVQPDWDSPHSLFGYYNSLEGKFNATSLLKVLYQAQCGVKESISDCLTIVLLDEMNLAHVELYFSELLSKLELLRNKKDGVNLEIDIAEDQPYKINLNNSIMWVGTMNEDETTKSLSDKVIDRGNLISFPRPKELITRSKLEVLNETPRLKKSTWDSWKWTLEKEDKLSKKIEIIKGVVERINEALDRSGRAIGHRVWQSIESYVKNYPLVLSNIDEENELNKYIKIAFEDALVQKLMPKLRGLETSGDIRENCLDKIKEIIDLRANGISKDFDIALNNPYGVFVWSSSSYLEEDVLDLDRRV